MQAVAAELVPLSAEWRHARLGCLTGTRFARALGSIQTRIKLIQELQAERRALASGKPIVFDDPDFPNGMHGREMEGRAIAEYQVRHWIDDAQIKRPAILTYKKHKWIKFSPDFLECLEEGCDEYCKLVEIKSPVDVSIHMATLYRGMDQDHKAQTQGGLMVSGLRCGVFLSYHASFKSKEQLYSQPFDRDETYISTLESACFEILDHVQNGTIPEPKMTSLPRFF